MGTGHRDPAPVGAASHRTRYWASFAVAGAVVLVAVAAAALLAGRSGTPRRPAGTPARLPVLVAGSYRGRRPPAVDFSTGPGSAVNRLTWTSWDQGRARASGTFEYDTCTRGCARGPFDPYPATIELSDPVDGQFTVLTRAVAAGPTRGVTTWTYPLRWPVGAG